MRTGGNMKDFWYFDVDKKLTISISVNQPGDKVLLKVWDNVDRCQATGVLFPTHARMIASALKKTADSVLRRKRERNEKG